MNNILESINLLSWNKELKKNFIDSFEIQINWLADWDEKWNNYKTFIENKDTLELFFDNYDFGFIINYITEYIDDSDADDDKISDVIYDNLYLMFTKKDKNKYRDKLIELLNMFWYILRTNFYNTNYNDSSKTYIWLKDNLVLLKIVLIIILSFIKDKDYIDIKDIKTDFDYLFWNNFNNVENKRIYQYLAFKQNDEIFNEHLLIISFLVLFLEDDKGTVYNLKNKLSHVSDYEISQIFESINEMEWEKYKEYLIIIKDFWLVYNLLRKIESNKWIDKKYKENILLILIKDNLLKNDEIIDFSILFWKNDEIRKEYIGLIKWIKFDEKMILDKLNGDNETISKDFLLIEENKKYIKGKILKSLIDNLKDEFIKNIELEAKTYWVLYQNILNWKYWDIKLDLSLEKFEYNFIEKIIDDIEWEKITLKYIDKVIVKKDLNGFYKTLIKYYINNIWIWEEFSVKNIREDLLIEDYIIKIILKKIKDEWSSIIWLSWRSRYKIIWEIV